jgi:hypothetical protein
MPQDDEVEFNKVIDLLIDCKGKTNILKEEISRV